MERCHAPRCRGWFRLRGTLAHVDGDQGHIGNAFLCREHWAQHCAAMPVDVLAPWGEMLILEPARLVRTELDVPVLASDIRAGSP